jgi:hypothetical protein
MLAISVMVFGVQEPKNRQYVRLRFGQIVTGPLAAC